MTKYLHFTVGGQFKMFVDSMLLVLKFVKIVNVTDGFHNVK